MMTNTVKHELKVLPQFFQSILSGDKTFEVRKNDRNYMVGDILHLREWYPDCGYLGREDFHTITYILEGGQFGIEKGYVVMGISRT